MCEKGVIVLHLKEGGGRKREEGFFRKMKEDKGDGSLRVKTLAFS